MTIRGFTLLETLIYIGLYALVMEGALAGIFALSESADRNQSKAYLEEEGNFISDKISYEISQATTVTLSNHFATSTEIDLVSSNRLPISIKLVGDSLTLTRGSGLPIPFSSNLVRVTDTAFIEGGEIHLPPSMHISFTLQAQSASGQTLSKTFSLTMYPNL